MREQLERLKNEALQAINSAACEDSIQDVRVKYLGRRVN